MIADIGKRQVFVGSSTEGKKIAELVISTLARAGLHPLPWFDFFKHERPPIQELERIALRAHAAVLVETSDDRALIRNQQWTQARDNVLYEYGLFSGTLGRSKCGLLVPDQSDFRIPTRETNEAGNR
jgi:predicted nucleotide-binding protein